MNQVVVPNNQYMPCPCTKDEFRAGIYNLERLIIEEMPPLPVEPEVEHFFADGCYGRKIKMLKGSIIVGKIHKHSHINVISQGIIQVWTEFDTVTYEAPITFVSKPFTKRLVKALEDTVWTTAHVTDETDLEKIEAEVIAPDYESLGGDV